MVSQRKTAIRKFVLDMQRPYLGICLGHQLLADATGGRVGLAKSPEVGVLTVSSTEAGRRDPLLSALPDPMTVLQWHGQRSPTYRPMPRYSPSRMCVRFRPSALANTPMVFNVMSKLPAIPSANGQPYRPMRVLLRVPWVRAPSLDCRPRSLADFRNSIETRGRSIRALRER